MSASDVKIYHLRTDAATGLKPTLKRIAEMCKKTGRVFKHFSGSGLVFNKPSQETVGRKANRGGK